MRRLFSKTAAFSFCGRLKGLKWADADVERWVELNLEAARGHAGIVIELPSSPPRETSFSSALATQDEVMHPSEVITLRRLPSTPLVLQMMRSGCGPGVFFINVDTGVRAPLRSEPRSPHRESVCPKQCHRGEARFRMPLTRHSN